MDIFFLLLIFISCAPQKTFLWTGTMYFNIVNYRQSSSSSLFLFFITSTRCWIVAIKNLHQYLFQFFFWSFFPFFLCLWFIKKNEQYVCVKEQFISHSTDIQFVETFIDAHFFFHQGRFLLAYAFDWFHRYASRMTNFFLSLYINAYSSNTEADMHNLILSLSLPLRRFFSCH